MTRPSCPSCRLRFADATAPTVVCPLCGEVLERMAAEDVLGFQLVVVPRPARVTDVAALMRAVAAAAREESSPGTLRRVP